MPGPDDNAHSEASVSKRSSRLRTAWGYLFPTLAFLLIVEGGFRLFPHRDADNTVSGIVEPDPELLWRLTPQPKGPTATNELGLRDDPHRADADLKILLLGDSISWGDSIVKRERLFASLTEKKLEDREPGTSFEVINAGVPGYSTFQEKRYLELRGDALDPDLVVLQFCLNDVVERYHAIAAYGGDNVFLGIDTRDTVRGLHGALLRSSRFYEQAIRWAQQRSRKREMYSVRRLAVDELSAELDAAWDQTLAELDGIFEWTARRSIPALLLISPYRFQLEDPQGLGQPQARLTTYVKDRNIAVLDLLPAFATASRIQSTDLFVDENHLSVAGHELAAELLTNKTQEMRRSAQQ